MAALPMVLLLALLASPARVFGTNRLHVSSATMMDHCFMRTPCGAGNNEYSKSEGNARGARKQETLALPKQLGSGFSEAPWRTGNRRYLVRSRNVDATATRDGPGRIAWDGPK